MGKSASIFLCLAVAALKLGDVSECQREMGL